MTTLKINRPLVIFDLETTGTSISFDRIVEIGLIKVFPDGREEKKTWRIDPGIPIPPEVSAIHGIYDVDVQGKPSFKDIAPELAGYFRNCDIAGFNSNRFDLPFIIEEFLKAEVEFDYEQAAYVDVQRIFHLKEPRTLSAALRFYCQKELENAHSALADTEATWEVLKAQLARYPDLEPNISGLAKFTGADNMVDFATRMIRDDKGREIFNFGKHKGKLVSDVLRDEPSYYDWIINNDFPLDTKRKLTKIRLRMRQGG